jgi:hypothetical protein
VDSSFRYVLSSSRFSIRAANSSRRRFRPWTRGFVAPITVASRWLTLATSVYYQSGGLLEKEKIYQHAGTGQATRLGLQTANANGEWHITRLSSCVNILLPNLVPNLQRLVVCRTPREVGADVCKRILNFSPRKVTWTLDDTAGEQLFLISAVLLCFERGCWG